MRYLNNAGTSWPKPKEVFDAVDSTLHMPPQKRADAFERIHHGLCTRLGVSQPERLLLTGSCTSALSLALADLPWAPGDRVLTSSLEHHAMVRPLLELEAHRGVRVERSPYRPGQPFDLGWARGQLREGGVKLIACTAASNVTGELLPTSQIGALARAHDALFLMDAAQSAGVTPLDFASSEADIIVLAGHKGPLATWGIGLLWAAPRVDSSARGAQCELPSEGEVPPCSSFPSYCDAGSVNLAAAAGLVAGLDWLGAHPEAMPRARELASELARWVSEREGAKLFGSVGAKRTATVGLALESLPLDQTEAFFAERGVIVRAGSHCARWALEALDSPGGCLRISFGPFCTAEDLAAVVDCLEAASA